MGHSTVLSTEIYVSLVNQEEEDTVERLDFRPRSPRLSHQPETPTSPLTPALESVLAQRKGIASADPVAIRLLADEIAAAVMRHGSSTMAKPS